MNRKKVYIVCPSGSYNAMFAKGEGYEIVDSPDKASFIQFTGGADVGSTLYGEEPHPSTWADPQRDDMEVAVFEWAKKRGMPMAGVCRGLQLLCVMDGGKMYQNINGHAVMGTHGCVDTKTGELYPVSSTHHQSIRVTKDHVVLAVACRMALGAAAGPISSFKEIVVDGEIVELDPKLEDIEAAYFPRINAFGVQGHPEYSNVSKCTSMYLHYLEKYLLNPKQGAT